jgi:hypothetical protein
VHGELAQVIALAAHGSAWLRGITAGAPPPLENGNSTFQYVRRVRFEIRRSSFRPATSASGVGGWLEGAREREIDRFWLSIPEPGAVTTDGHEVPDRMLVAFAGAGRWFLVGTSRDQSRELWRASWAVGDEEAPDQRIWDVEYRGEPSADAGSPLRPEISASAERLIGALEEIEVFARDQRLGDWADWFADARRLGAAEHPQAPYHPDMLPALGFAKPARQLLAMATRAWVFGGMGSWNDLGFEARTQEDEYNRLSAKLYSSVLGAFVAAVNADLEA